MNTAFLRKSIDGMRFYWAGRMETVPMNDRYSFNSIDAALKAARSDPKVKGFVTETSIPGVYRAQYEA